MNRPRTPDFLRKLVYELYEERCLRCKVERPLAVAHLDSWPSVRARAQQRYSPDVAGLAFWAFHQPSNVVLLCCNCHALFDSRKARDSDVDLAVMITHRDRVMWTPRFGDVVRRFVCREMGSVRRRPVAVATLAPLSDWLAEAIERATLSPPHRFVVQWGTSYWQADLASAAWEHEPAVDPSLPVWDPRRQVFQPGSSH